MFYRVLRDFWEQIDWSVYLNAIYNEGAGVEVPTNERIIVVETDYLKKLVALLDVTDNRVIGKQFSGLVGTYSSRQKY
jgi:hypothetical protein